MRALERNKTQTLSELVRQLFGRGNRFDANIQIFHLGAKPMIWNVDVFRAWRKLCLPSKLETCLIVFIYSGLIKDR